MLFIMVLFLASPCAAFSRPWPPLRGQFTSVTYLWRTGGKLLPLETRDSKRTLERDNPDTVSDTATVEPMFVAFL